MTYPIRTAIRTMATALALALGVTAVAFLTSIGQAQADVIADVRVDYDAVTAGPPTDGEPGIFNAMGTGTWKYLASDNPNPISDSSLDVLPWHTVNSRYQLSTTYGSAVSVGLWATESDEVNIHPSYWNRPPPYAVVRWIAGPGEAGFINITGTIRKLVMGGDGVTYKIFVNGEATSIGGTLTGSDSTGVSFDETLTVGANAKVDFVIGSNWDDSYDSTGLKVTISLVDNDNDGFAPPIDCNDDDAAINPDVPELPGNFVDENCDGNLGYCSPCDEWKNHGQYVRCVAQDAETLVNGGILTEEEGDALVTSSAQSSVGKKGFVPDQCVE